ncbi:MAG: histidine kinase [Ignavibacteria bacterium]|jgi:signal transduction histidine kinase
MKSYINFLCLLFYLILTCAVHGQNSKKEIDSINAISSEFINSNLDSSLIIFTGNLKKAESIDYKYGEAEALNKLSFINYLKGNLDESTENILKAINIYEELKSYEKLSFLYGEFGYRLKQHDIKTANHYMRMGINIAEKHQFTAALNMLYDNYGVLKEIENNLDSATYYYNKALVNKKKLGDTVGIPFSFNKLAGAYAQKGDYQKALEYLDSSDTYRNKEIGDYGRAENLVLRGEIFQMQEKADSALTAFLGCLRLSKKLKNTNLTQYCYEQLSKLYERKKNYKKAFENYRNHTAYKDTLINIETNKRIAELQTAYETEKKDRLLADKALEIEEKNNMLVILISIAGLMIIITIWIYRTQKQKRERIKNELELKNQLNKAHFENRLRSEMLRISRELHDNIGSQLTFMISSLDNLMYSLNNNKIVNKINTLRSFGRDILTELRNTVWVIKQEEGDIHQLVLKIHELVQKLNSEIAATKIKLKNNIKEKLNITSTQMLNIFRIVQEAVQNSIKHADSTEIIIEFDKSGNGFLLSIDDNGKGIDNNNISQGSGLQNMKLRCEEANGDFTICSNCNGTKITCSFSIN